jgi:hypothetical protein
MNFLAGFVNVDLQLTCVRANLDVLVDIHNFD